MTFDIHPEPHRSLADRLFELGVEFPCGGETACGGCKIRVLSGHVPITPTMRQALSEAELAHGWRLACCAEARESVVVEVDQWSLTVLTDEQATPLEPRPGFGAVIDLGTTTLVAQLVDLSSGEVLAVETALNPQARHGADVMSRIQYDLRHPGELTAMIRQTLGQMLARLAGGRAIEEVLLAGNTAMHHLFCGLSITPLAAVPFLSPELEERRFTARELGWPGGARSSLRAVHFLPCLGGFVGSDLLAGIVATRLHEQSATHALFDIGTNGEIVLGSRHGILCASTAAGPAFEGGRISAGMTARAGAIDAVRVEDGAYECHVLGGQAARGICGSGLVDA
ncbi:MAG: ASKHA domain-containing protein, partial [Bryobacteraceae bacterium]